MEDTTLAIPATAAIAPLVASRPTAWHRVSTHERTTIGDVWHVTALPPDAAGTPDEALNVARTLGRDSILSTGTCTVAAALARVSAASRAEHDAFADGGEDFPDLDASDWWFRTTFDADGVQHVARYEAHGGTMHDVAIPCVVASGATISRATTQRSTTRTDVRLTFDGLATIVDVWLNDVWLGRADNMFLRWEAQLPELARSGNELVLCARAMIPRLAPRRPRARWRARLLASQEWRWHRTTQLGRMAGFGPPTPPVGPWRSISRDTHLALDVAQLSVHPRLENDVATLDVVAQLGADSGIRSAVLTCGDVVSPMRITSLRDGCTLRAHLASTALAVWWPHTHGVPHTHATYIDVTLETGQVARIELGDIGFRRVDLDTTDDGFSIAINSHRLFVRGVCWTPRDWTNLDLVGAELDAELRLLCEAGVNCVRLSGCFTYPSHDFLAACDRHGVLVWQDLMFSVLDYPEDDGEFARSCEVEAEQVLASMQSHACVMVVCGNAEVAQQAAMMGLPPSSLGHGLFRQRLAAIARHTLPAVPYWPSTPWGGALPFEVDKGTAHYFGVGAYRRALHDARRSGVRFTTECLAFAHVAEPESLEPGGAAASDPRTPSWKRRVPRDGGASWDFEDVRDHYVAELFGESPAALRSTDPARYLALGRAASAIAVERTMQEFRRTSSSCGGALMWLWSDPWIGAGWGCIDSTGRPKSAWYAFRRAARPIALALTNEGMNGAHLHAWNDSPAEVRGTLVLRLLRDGVDEMLTRSVPLVVAPRSTVTRSCDELVGHFTDIVYAYRFGPPAHDVVHALWLHDDSPAHESREPGAGVFGGRAIIDEAVLLPHGDERPVRDTGLRVDDITRVSATHAALTLSCTRTTTHVRIGSHRWRADDSYFTLVPGVQRRVNLHLSSTLTKGGSARVTVDALDSCNSIQVAVPGLTTSGSVMMLRAAVPAVT